MQAILYLSYKVADCFYREIWFGETLCNLKDRMFYLERQDIFDLSIFSRGMWTRDVGVTAAAESGMEKHGANCGCCGPTHGAVTALR